MKIRNKKTGEIREVSEFELDQYGLGGNIYKSGGQHGGLDRWFAEKWVDIKTGKPCGRQEGEDRNYPACRPSKRISSATPKTASELSSSEKQKFKQEKTSSQRISYNHKRMEYGGENISYMKSGGNVPTNPELWSRAKSAARSKYDVYPCVPMDSQALTKEGWKHYNELSIGEDILAYNQETNKNEWTPIISLQKFEDAPIIRLYKSQTNFDIKCTPNHKWVLAESNLKYPDNFVEAKDITKHMKIKISAELSDNGNGLNLNTFFKKDSWVKNILKMSISQIQSYFASGIVYDGHDKGLTKKEDKQTYGFSQKEKDHGLAMEIAAVLLGYRVCSVIKKHNSTMMSWTFIKRNTESTQNLHKEDAGTSDVWCPTTKFGTWVMKQNGYVTITGNSAYANGFAAKWYKSHGGGWRKAEYGMEVMANGGLIKYQDKGEVVNLNNPIQLKEIVIKPELSFEQKINRWLGNPMGQAERDAEVKKWFNPKTKKWQREDPIDNVRHTSAGRYVAEAIANKTGNIPYVSNTLGYLGSNLLGAAHEASTYFIDPRWNDKKSGFFNNFKVITRTGLEDLYNNNIGAMIGLTPFTPFEKTRIIKNLSNNNLIPDGYGEVDPFHKGIKSNYQQGGQKMPPQLAYARFAAAGNLDQLDNYGYQIGGEIPTVQGTFKKQNKYGYWVTDEEALAKEAQRLNSKKVLTEGGSLIIFDDNWNIVAADDNPNEPYKQGGSVTLNTGGENHRIYVKTTNRGEGAKGHIMVNHPTMDKGMWDTIDLTEKSGATTIAQGVAATKKWHRENPYKKQEGGGITLPNDFNKFQQFNKTLPKNLRDDNFKYGDYSHYDLYGMWDAAGKPNSFDDVKDSENFRLQEDGTYHGFSVGNDGVWLKPKSHPSAFMEYMQGQLNPDPYFLHNHVIQKEDGRLQYVPNNYITKQLLEQKNETDIPQNINPKFMYSAPPFVFANGGGIPIYGPGGENPPKKYTDYKAFLKAERLYKDSLDTYNNSNSRIKENFLNLQNSKTKKEFEEKLEKTRKKYPTNITLKIPKKREINYSRLLPDGSMLRLFNDAYYKKPVQPVIYQPASTHPIEHLERMEMMAPFLNNPEVIPHGELMPVPQMQLPQQGTIPFYGPGNTIIGYTDDDRQFYPLQYSGAKNNQLNLLDKELLANPEMLQKFVQSKDNYKFAKGGLVKYQNGEEVIDINPNNPIQLKEVVIKSEKNKSPYQFKSENIVAPNFSNLGQTTYVTAPLTNTEEQQFLNNIKIKADEERKRLAIKKLLPAGLRNINQIMRQEDYIKLKKGFKVDKPYAIIDKIGNVIRYYDENHRMIKEEPVITGESNKDIDKEMSWNDFLETHPTAERNSYLDYLQSTNNKTTPSGIYKLHYKDNLLDNPSKIGKIADMIIPGHKEKTIHARSHTYGKEGKMFTLTSQYGIPSSKAIHGTGYEDRLAAFANNTNRDLSNGCINVNGKTICFDFLKEGSDVYILPEENNRLVTYKKSLHSISGKEDPVRTLPSKRVNEIRETKNKFANISKAANLGLTEDELNFATSVAEKESKGGRSNFSKIESSVLPGKLASSYGTFEMKESWPWLKGGNPNNDTVALKAIRDFYRERFPGYEASGYDKNFNNSRLYTEYNTGKRKNEYMWGEDYLKNLYPLTEYSEGGGIPERYRNMGFTSVGAKKQSTRPGKKWMVLAKKGDDYKVVHGGYKGMQDFKQHHSEQRKENFWSRMGGRNSSKATDPFSPLYWHKRFGTWKYGGQPMAVGGQNVMNPIVKKDNRNWLEYLKN